MLDIKVAKDLKPKWEKTAKNYAHMFLSSFSDQIRFAELWLDNTDNLEASQPGFRCRVCVEFPNGQQVLVEAENNSVELVLEQTLSRSRRTLVRHIRDRSLQAM